MYNLAAIFEDEELFNAIVEDYAESRFENDGGDPCKTSSFDECLSEVIADYKDKLEKHLLSNIDRHE